MRLTDFYAGTHTVFSFIARHYIFSDLNTLHEVYTHLIIDFKQNEDEGKKITQHCKLDCKIYTQVLQ